MGAKRSKSRLLSQGRGAPVREALVLGISAIVVIAGAAISKRQGAPSTAPSASQAPSLEMPPLPSGAPIEALPTDDERAAGCHFEERGFGDYNGWRDLPIGKVLIPSGRAIDEDGSFPLLIHFHGAEPVRKQLAPEGLKLIIAGIDAGTGSGAYARAFADPTTFDRLIASIEARVAAENHIARAHAGPLALSSWSAGYGAITQILAHPHPRIDALILLDSLYAGYQGGTHTLAHGQLVPFLGLAEDALNGGAIFYLTHTAIPTPGYASTAEVASFLLRELDRTADEVTPSGDPAERYPLRRILEEKRLVIRGYDGADRDAHCAQLHHLPAVLRESVLPVWSR